MFAKLCTTECLFSAWKQVKSKNSTGGIDGLSILDFEDKIDVYLKQMQNDLISGTWNPEPYLRIEIKKNETEKRKLGLLSIKDKIVQQGIRSLIEPTFERMFLGNSYGYRPQKGHLKAVRRTINEFGANKNSWVVQLDIDNYFDTINHDILFSRLQSVINDKEILRLIELSVKMGIVNKKLKWSQITEGVPQGAILSPLIANFYLHSFDQFVTSRTKNYIRYADDFVMIAPTKEEAETLKQRASDYLQKRLLLTLNPPVISKVSDGIEFLGVVLKGSAVSISQAKRIKLLERIHSIRLIDGRFDAKSIESLAGIKRYYAQLLPQSVLLEFDQTLLEKVNQQIKTTSIPNKKTFAITLKSLPLFANETELKRSVLIQEWIKTYLEYKHKIKTFSQTKKNNQTLIDKRKKEYQKLEGENSELIISSFGSFIGKSNTGITVKVYGKNKHNAPSNALQHITVTSRGVSISSDAIHYCAERNIPIDFFDHSGKLFASIMSPVSINQDLWHKQSVLPLEQKIYLASVIISAKLKNQMSLVKYYHKYHKVSGVLSECYTELLATMGSLLTKIQEINSNENQYREILMSYEAIGATTYWKYVRQLLLDDKITFDTRIRKGADDIFNSLLNYGYALLYARVWQALLAAKLNPSIGLLHSDRSGKPTLSYDMIELFRAQAVDRIVISLVQTGQSLVMEKALLDETTKKLLIQNIFERFNRYEKYRGKEIKFFQIIREQSRELATYITGDSKTFKPYLAKW